MVRWYLLDGEIGSDRYRALCYEDDELIEAEMFDDRWKAMDHGENWLYDGEHDDGREDRGRRL